MRGAELNGRLLGLFMGAELLILAIFDLAVILKGGSPQGLSLQPFHPGTVLSGAVGVSVMFALASYVGFEATALYREEARDPERTIPKATYLAVCVITLFYALSSWAVVMAYGPARAVAAAQKDTANFWFTVNTQFVGSFSTSVMSVLLVTSIFASIPPSTMPSRATSTRWGVRAFCGRRCRTPTRSTPRRTKPAGCKR